MGLEQLKKMAASRGLQSDKKDKPEKLVEALLAEEARLREAVAAYEVKLQEVVAKKKEELELKTGNELKELCMTKGLPAGVGKETRVERLLAEAKESGELDKIFVTMAREARTAELQGESLELLVKFCKQLGADPLMKDVMIERLIAHEKVFGPINLEASSKKSKSSKK